MTLALVEAVKSTKGVMVSSDYLTRDKISTAVQIWTLIPVA